MKASSRFGPIRRATYFILRSFGRLIFMTLAGFACTGFLVFMGLVGYLVYIQATLPDIRDLSHADSAASSRIYSRDGTLLYEIRGEYSRQFLPLANIPANVQHATIAIEDKNFYQHGAISWPGIARAILVNFQSKDAVQGGSTITQQFVKTALLTREKTLGRKLREVLLARQLEDQFSKDQILELYLNEIPYGRNAYGIEAAARAYFDKSAQDLTLAESAYLVALPQAPTYLSPTGEHRAELDARKNLILDQMAEQKYISPSDAQAAKNAVVNFPVRPVVLKAPHFVFWLRQYLDQKYGRQMLEEGGLSIHTTLDLNRQASVEGLVRNYVPGNAKKNGAYNAAAVVVEPATGQILSMVGSKDFWGQSEPAGCRPGVNCRFEPQVNVAAAPRQPGSSFKPYAYLTAFTSAFGYTPDSTVLDAPTVFGYSGGQPYTPQNYSGGFLGLVTMRKALAGSLNIPAVKVLTLTGIDAVINTTRRLGITAPLKNCGLTLVLGGCEISLVDHVGAMATIANMGLGSGATPILEIRDKSGRVLEKYETPSKQAVEPEAAYQLISVMTDNSARSYIFGDKTPLAFTDRPVAAKTGTTQNWKDGWTVGFTPDVAVGVWVGNNDGTLLKAGSDAIFSAAPLWREIMDQFIAGTPAHAFPVPSGIVQVAYDASSGKLATNQTKNIRWAPYPWYALPKSLTNQAQKRGNKKLVVPLGATIPESDDDETPSDFQYKADLPN